MNSPSDRNQIPQYTSVWMCTTATWSSSRPKKKDIYYIIIYKPDHVAAKFFLGCTLSKFSMMKRSSHIPFATDPEFTVSLIKSCLRDCSIMDATHKLDVS